MDILHLARNIVKITYVDILALTPLLANILKQVSWKCVPTSLKNKNYILSYHCVGSMMPVLAGSINLEEWESIQL